PCHIAFAGPPCDRALDRRRRFVGRAARSAAPMSHCPLLDRRESSLEAACEPSVARTLRQKEMPCERARSHGPAIATIPTAVTAATAHLKPPFLTNRDAQQRP